MPLERDERPWGSYEVVVEDLDHKVKQIVVKPGMRLSYFFSIHTTPSVTAETTPSMDA